MLEEKKVVNFPDAEIIQLNLGTHKVAVKTYLSGEEQDTLIAIYMSALTGEHGSIAFAERSLLISVIETVTNIKLVDESGEEIKALVTIDQVFANYPFWIKIKLAIKNYDYFRKILDDVVDEYRENRRLSVSLGVRLENIFDKAEAFLQNISTNGLSPEMISETRTLLGEINDSEILKESVKAFRKQDVPAKKTSKKPAVKKAKTK